MPTRLLALRLVAWVLSKLPSTSRLALLLRFSTGASLTAVTVPVTVAVPVAPDGLAMVYVKLVVPL